MRERLAGALRDALKNGEQTRAATLRLISMALSDRAAGSQEDIDPALEEARLGEIMRTMLRQRAKQIRAYEEAGRLELAAMEEAEAAILREFLPREMSDAEIGAAIDAAIDETGATGLRDLGRVMALLRQRHEGSMEFKGIGQKVKARLEAARG
jgi:uncharacterized protein YqeY